MYRRKWRVRGSRWHGVALMRFSPHRRLDLAFLWEKLERIMEGS